MKKKNKVLLIGWDAADWKVINPLLDSGQMPALQKIVENGTIGNIMTLEPPLSPMLWTSIATGKTADKHGILGFVEPDIDNGGIKYIEVTSRKSRELWNIFHNQGLKSNVINWWPSYPVEPINGVYVANSFLRFSEDPEKPLALLKNTIYPEEYYKHLPRFKVHPSELTEQHIQPFIPNYKKLDVKNSIHISGVLKELANTSTIQAVTTYLMEETEWDFTAVYFDSIDHLCHGFMKYHPPQLKGILDVDFDLFKHVINSTYKFYDMMLERLMELAGEDTTVIIVSDHGFKSDHTRMVEIPDMPSSPAFDHRNFGILCFYGPNVKKDERVYGATLLDVAPTILSIMDLPIAKDMDGKVLSNCFKNVNEAKFIDSWEDIDGDFGEHKEKISTEDLFASAEALQQLIDLGYVADYGDDKKKAFEMAKAEQEYNLGQSFRFSGKLKKALTHFQKAKEANSVDERFNYALTDCLIQMRRFDEAKEAIEFINSIENKQLLYNYDYLEGSLYAMQSNSKTAIECFLKAEQSDFKTPQLYLQLGKQYLRLSENEKALEIFDEALALDDDSNMAYHGKGIAYLYLGDYENAVDNFLRAIGLVYHFSPSHYFLGLSFIKMQKITEACQALEICLILAPKNMKARRHLINLYTDYIRDDKRVEYHQKLMDEYSKGKITIVSGLPRSGTSLMMQILEAAGLDILSDEERSADDNNPKGYFEYEPVKKIAQDNLWMKDASGKCLKVIAYLIKYLPSNFEYKILYMKRDIIEIITSQQKMLGKSLDVYPAALDMAYKKEEAAVLNYISENSNMDILVVNYSDLVNNNESELKRIADFLELEMDLIENVVDPNLYRNRNSK